MHSSGHSHFLLVSCCLASSFITLIIIVIIISKHLADLLQHLGVGILLDKFDDILLATVHDLTKSLPGGLGHISRALGHNVAHKDSHVAAEHLLLVRSIVSHQGGAGVILGGEILLAAVHHGGLDQLLAVGVLSCSWPSEPRLDSSVEACPALLLS